MMIRTLALSLLLACNSGPTEAASPATDKSTMATTPPVGPGQAAAVFAGGCFWCMESDFDKLPGVIATTSGYAGGHLKSPTYEDVVREDTGHQEVVHVVYDTSKLSYEALLDYFWRHVDPTDNGGQFCDRGDSYRPLVFTASPEQLQVAEKSKAALTASGVLAKPVVVEVKPLTVFYPAEVYHQDFHTKNPDHYQRYRKGCGRDARVRAVWGGA